MFDRHTKTEHYLRAAVDKLFDIEIGKCEIIRAFAVFVRSKIREYIRDIYIVLAAVFAAGIVQPDERRMKRLKLRQELAVPGNTGSVIKPVNRLHFSRYFFGINFYYHSLPLFKP